MTRLAAVLVALFALYGCTAAALDVHKIAVASRPDTVRMIFAGDVMLDDGVGRAIAAGDDPLAEFDAFLRDADYTVGNLECAIATTGEATAHKPYTFRAHPSVLRVLRGRFDAMSVANNHSRDYGHQAFDETLEHLQRAGIAFFGGGRNLREAHAPLWIERNGVRIALLGYNEFQPRFFEAGPTWSGIAWSEDSEVVADIRAARGAGADVVIPFMHWDWEKEPKPSERSQRLAQLMIEAGADAVVGGHPHVTQGAAIYKDRPIVWSLGNFVFDGFETAETRRGWLLRLTLDRYGVAAWNTIAVDIDEAGMPHPVKGERTPCGQRGDSRVQHCGAMEAASAPPDQTGRPVR